MTTVTEKGNDSKLTYCLLHLRFFYTWRSPENMPEKKNEALYHLLISHGSYTLHHIILCCMRQSRNLNKAR
ncbi:hypothetical protein Y1Q_0008946 [Alligator mississippiensis]|uniref:Uncharacterized protein n=1 Tax=Alligator mississippiensis TaxID=8496 RepID=A0A151NKD8_ALLMI|nr:hypothetical protein Y1Q_0008946 [Alligator mississippiensis]